MTEDERILEYLWDNWDSQDLTIEKLIELVEDAASEEIRSEIWHLISVKSLKKTALHAKQAIEGGSDKSFVHDNLLFGHGLCNGDFNKRDLNSLVSFYNGHIEREPGSVISRRCQIEVLLENRRYREAEQRILEAKKMLPDKHDVWEFYSVWIIWSDGEKDQAISELEKLSSRNPDDYLMQFMIAEFYAEVCEYELALRRFDRAFHVQRGKRRIDPLIAQMKIHEILGNTEMALRAVKLIREVFQNDYKVQDGPEVEIWIQKEEQLIRRIEIEQLNNT